MPGISKREVLPEDDPMNKSTQTLDDFVEAKDSEDLEEAKNYSFNSMDSSEKEKNSVNQVLDDSILKSLRKLSGGEKTPKKEKESSKMSIEEWSQVISTQTEDSKKAFKKKTEISEIVPKENYYALRNDITWKDVVIVWLQCAGNLFCDTVFNIPVAMIFVICLPYRVIKLFVKAIVCCIKKAFNGIKNMCKNKGSTETVMKEGPNVDHIESLWSDVKTSDIIHAIYEYVWFS